MADKENFIVSARKYRPSIWGEVVGQEAITDTLKNSIEQGHLAHAYLFCGPRGVGKTTCARIFAREINRSGDLDDEDFSFNIFELDAASNNKVDEMRALIDQVRIPPQVGKYKVYVIDEVHMLTTQAFNAFLKTLEEPPKHAIFILATTEKHKIIPTILSRCQIYDFNRILVDDIVKHLKNIALKEKIKFEEEALHIIALKADGALRDALSILDQLSSFTNENLTYDSVLKNLHVVDYDYYFKICNHLNKAEYADALLILDQVLKLGFDGGHFLSGLASHLRDLLVCQDIRTLALLEVGESVKSQYQQQAKNIGVEWLLEALNIIPQFEFRMRGSSNQRLLIEVTLLSLATISHQKKNFNPETQLAQVLKPTNSESPQLSETKDKESEKNPTQIELGPTVQVRAPKYTESYNDADDEEPKQIISEPNVPQLSHRKRRPPMTVSLNMEQKPELIEHPESESTDEGEAELKVDEGSSDLISSWKSLTEQLRSEGKNALYSIMVRQAPEVDENNTTEIQLQHDVEEEEFNIHRTEILSKLRKLTGNKKLQLRSSLTEIKTETKLFTAKDKFEYLATKNPELLKLKQDLDLDISF